MFSDVISLKNEGKSGLKITSIDYPQGIGSTIDPAVVDLDANASLDFKLSYTAALTTPQSGYVTLHTTGGDLQIRCSQQRWRCPTDTLSRASRTDVRLPDGPETDGRRRIIPSRATTPPTLR